MKKIFYLMCVAAIAAGTSFSVKAQDYPSLEGSNYYLIWLDGETESDYGITDKIVQDLRPTWDGQTNPDGAVALYIWENGTQWAGVPATGLGSFDQVGGFLSFNKSLDWAGLGFCMRGDTPERFNVDFTAITEDYRFHMALKAPAGKSLGVELYGQTGGKAAFAVGSPAVNPEGFSPNVTPNFVADAWNIVDIPVSDLTSRGFLYRTTLVSGNFFNIISPDQGNAWNIGLDAVFLYKPSASGINNPKAENKLRVLVTNQIVEVLNATAPVEVYDIAGIKVKTSEEPVFGVEELKKGAYIVKSGKAVAKVIIK
jgi:hypothetical protein